MILLLTKYKNVYCFYFFCTKNHVMWMLLINHYYYYYCYYCYYYYYYYYYFPRNHNVNVLFPQLKHLDNIENAEFQSKIIETIQNIDDLQKYILASSEIGQNIQEEIELVVTDGKLNDARVRQAWDPLYKMYFEDKILMKLSSKINLKFLGKIQ